MCRIIKPCSISLCLRYECPLLCCLCILLAYRAWDEKIVFRVQQSLVLPCSLKKGMSSGVSVIAGGRVITSKIRQTGFHRLPLLCGGRRQLKRRVEFQIIPEYIVCTQLFLIEFSDSLASVGEGKWDRTVSESPPETVIPVRLHY